MKFPMNICMTIFKPTSSLSLKKEPIRLSTNRVFNVQSRIRIYTGVLQKVETRDNKHPLAYLFFCYKLRF